MRPEHYHALRELASCTFLPGSWNKRFVRDLSTLGPYDLLSPKQEVTVERLAHLYRRQIGEDLFPDAVTDFRRNRAEQVEHAMQERTGQPEPMRFRREGYHTHPIWPNGLED